ncbi:hypothetical protein [Variovorax sp. HW608]|uniref:hypothetical protein n=1 Tax=Variovorax sp. HW608 TaxID=1034889 RepID=UPI0012FD7F93|nr:hypothetical protein [Variovorax sp. HW608]
MYMRYMVFNEAVFTRKTYTIYMGTQSAQKKARTRANARSAELQSSKLGLIPRDGGGLHAELKLTNRG